MTSVLLHVAGTSHHDPMGNPHLKAWLCELAAANDRSPLFGAVEYDEEKFRELKRQRPRLRCELSEWRIMAPAVLDALTESLAYEPDAVLEVFPGTETLWLDQGTLESTEGVHGKWFAQYQRYADLKAVDFLTSDPNPLMLLSEATWECFARLGTQRPELRDEKFARVILERLQREEEVGASTSGRWAVVVVGANHALSQHGRARQRLIEAGVPCTAVRIETYGPVPM